MTAIRITPRSLGIPLSGTPGTANAITDVPGLAVGYFSHDALTPDGKPFRSGVTAILPDSDSVLWSYPAAVHSQNGNGEMTGAHWVRDSGRMMGPIMITNSHAIGAVHEGTVAWMIDRYAALYRDDHAWALPVVAETYDGFTNDILGMHVRPVHARAALEAALAFSQDAQRSGDYRIAQGNVGGGMGMQSFGLKGGSGSSSRRLDFGLGGGANHVAVFVQSNFGDRSQLRVAGQCVGPLLRQACPWNDAMPETGSIIAIVATDLPLDAKQLELLARRVPMGLARLGGTAGNYSGEITLALSVANRVAAAGVTPRSQRVHTQQVLDESLLDMVYEAVVQASEEAVLNAMFAAQSMPTHRPVGMLEQLDVAQVADLLADVLEPAPILNVHT